MSAKINNIRIGIFVLVGVALFIIGLLAFGARRYFARKDTYETAFEGEVAGLSVGSMVMYRGVPVGRVSKIDFAPNVYPASTSDVIVVEVQIDVQIFAHDQSAEAKDRRRKAEIEKGLRAMVKSQGVTGTSVVALEHLDPRENPPPVLDYKPDHPYVPSAPGQFTRMLESIEQSLRNIQRIDFPAIGAGVSNTLARATALLEKVNQLDLERTVGKADALLDQLKTTTVNVDATVKSLNLDTLSRDADGLVLGLQQSNAKLQTVLDHVSAVPMEQTVDDLRAALKSLNDVLLEMKRYPSGFIFGEPPLPAKSVRSPKE